MASAVFEIREHTLECQHIREYARATAESQEDILHLAIKQYIPLDIGPPREGDITIIGAHANGFPKELYEPLWEDIHVRSKKNGFRIRSIWIADAAQQGLSSVLNERLLGNDPSWSDHPRDLLHMVNHFRAEMPMPIVGIGHSYGANVLVNLSLIHPRLLSSLILLDPVIQEQASAPEAAGGVDPARASTFRRDLWPSRLEAEDTFRKQRFYKSWDPRVLDRWCKYGIRETPTALYPNAQGAATLTTTRDQECFTFLRPSWEAVSEDGKTIVKRDFVPDMHPKSSTKYPFYRPEPPNTLHRLRNLRPTTMYIFGEVSDVSPPEGRKQKMGNTGIGLGGSGGVKEGKVKQVVLDGIGHLVAMEASDKCADAASAWLGEEVKSFDAERENYKQWAKQGLEAKQTLSEEWKKRIGGPFRAAKI